MVRVTVASEEPLAPVSLEPALGLAPAELEFSSLGGGTVWEWTYRVQEGDEGSYALRTTPRDRVENEVEEALVAAVMLDGVAPSFHGLVVEPARVKRAATFTVRFDTDEEPRPELMVLVDGQEPHRNSAP